MVLPPYPVRRLVFKQDYVPHALFVHCHCHMLQLACVQTANSTTGIKHVYITFDHSLEVLSLLSKRVKRLKEIQPVLELPELKVINHLTLDGWHTNNV